ncbi:MAG: biotin--[acetyl-CoA-carboxylase] ligase [Mastigocoleus sp. MO_167.B18]|nr:biotin--[acetyl-CoA-carboxylase] ligase [Mastigocoleus sp. MO_167.B18]
MAVEFNRQKLELALEERQNYTNIFSSIHIFDTVSSTNTTAWELLKAGIKPGFAVIATTQTSGRGQWGREWDSPKGGLYLSVALNSHLEVNHGYQLTLASAWGIAQELRNHGIYVGIKWPNDLVLDGYKLGGILTETKVKQALITQAVIGVGINWENSTPETGINLQSWQKNQNNLNFISLEKLTAKIIQGIESGIHCLEREGVDILLSRYVRLLVNIGQKVYVNNNRGTIVGVNPSGSLHVRMESSNSESVTTPYIDLKPGTISLGYRKTS